MDTVSIKFSNKKSTTFIQDIKREVNTYFKENDISKNGDWRMYVKTVTMIGVYLGTYALIIL